MPVLVGNSHKDEVKRVGPSWWRNLFQVHHFSGHSLHTLSPTCRRMSTQTGQTSLSSVCFAHRRMS